MNLKASFVNFNYLKENFKKSKGVILLFILIVPVFTYLFMLMLSSSYNTVYFPQLADLSIPALFGMYIIPFITAVTLFNFVFKKDSVDFINALPLKRSTIYISNIVGGIALFLFIFLTTSLFMWLVSGFFDSLVIPTAMYYHFFITFFVTYTFAFIVSSLTLSLTGSRLSHVALTLIFLFIPGFMSDFYDSTIYERSFYYNYQPTCDIYDTECKTYEINNEFKIKESYKFENGKTLPYKYISFIPRAIFGMHENEVTFNSEVSSVYNLSSILRMIILSVIYFIIGLYVFIKRKMEVAESTFKNENTHQLVKCLTIFPLCLGAISIFSQEASLTALWIFTAVIVTIYIVYDLITRRNSGQFVKSVIYFLGLVLVTIGIYMGVQLFGNWQAEKRVEKNQVAHIGIAPNKHFGSNDYNAVFDVLEYKLKDKQIVDFIFNNANKKIESNTSEIFAIRLTLKNGKDYYYNMKLTREEYDKMLEMLDMSKDYTDKLKYIPYQKVYGLQVGYSYFDKSESEEIVTLIEEGFNNLKTSDIVNATYSDGYDGHRSVSSLACKLYTYDSRLKTYNVNTSINPKLVNYVMSMQNQLYIKDVKNGNVNINRLYIGINYNIDDFFKDYYYSLSNEENKGLVYKYINDNIKNDFDFATYNEEEIIVFDIWGNKSYQVFIPRNEAFEEMMKKVKENADKKGSSMKEFKELR